MSNGIASLCFDTYRFSMLINDWSVENMNPDMTLYKMSVDISASPSKQN